MNGNRQYSCIEDFRLLQKHSADEIPFANKAFQLPIVSHNFKDGRDFKCYSREAVIFKDSSRNYYLLLDVRFDRAEAGELINSENELGRRSSVRGS